MFSVHITVFISFSLRKLYSFQLSSNIVFRQKLVHRFTSQHGWAKMHGNEKVFLNRNIVMLTRPKSIIKYNLGLQFRNSNAEFDSLLYFFNVIIVSPDIDVINFYREPQRAQQTNLVVFEIIGKMFIGLVYMQSPTIYGRMVTVIITKISICVNFVKIQASAFPICPFEVSTTPTQHARKYSRQTVIDSFILNDACMRVCF